ncbi:MarC family protein [bacterium]|nr:MarC family protein [bacterium]
MEALLTSLVPFLAILNPFALCLYLAHVMEELPARHFVLVLSKAAGISFAVLAFFAVMGEPFLVDFLSVRPEAMRIFGGVLFFIVGYGYVTRGYKATELLRGTLEELPSEIAVPFMIGAGTITQAILLGKSLGASRAVLVLGLGMVISVVIVLAFRALRDRMKGERERVFERYVNLLSRLNGLVIGAISTDMVVTGVRRLWMVTEVGT